MKVKTKDGTIETDFAIGGSWGDAIDWFLESQFENATQAQTFEVVGWKTPRPTVGQTLYGEFRKSHAIFEFTSIDYKTDPRDMFFAEVKLIKQIKK